MTELQPRGYKLPQSVLVIIHSPCGQVLLIRRVDSGTWQSVTGSRDPHEARLADTYDSLNPGDPEGPGPEIAQAAATAIIQHEQRRGDEQQEDGGEGDERTTHHYRSSMRFTSSLMSPVSSQRMSAIGTKPMPSDRTGIPNV